MAGPAYRLSKVVDSTLRDTSNVLLDDELYPQAISFLSNLLCAGGSQSDSTGAPSTVPDARQLRLLSTIVVHPLFTTRSSSAERTEASNLAVRLLYDVSRTAGPVAAGFGTAFAFPRSGAGGRRGGDRRQRQGDSADSDDEEAIVAAGRLLESRYARSESVWARAEDFWHVVGWALNCAATQPKRWERWRPWLRWVVDAAVEDWEERERQAEHLTDAGDEAAAQDMLKQSMIFQYVVDLEGRNGRRRIVRAILAHGSQKCLNEFPEVWKNETKEKKRKLEEDDCDMPRKKLDLDEGEFGDYDVDEDEDEIADDADQEDNDTASAPTDSNGHDHDENDAGYQDPFELGATQLGGIDALECRLRLLSLLLRLADGLPNDFTYPDALLDVYTEFMRPLPLPHFAILVPNPHMDRKSRIALYLNTLLPLLAITPPKGSIYDVSRDRIVADFFPRAANSPTAIDNGKVSLLLEQVLGALAEESQGVATGPLRTAVEQGVRARKQKSIGDARKKAKGMTPDEHMAKQVLELSAERLAFMLELFQ